MRSGERAGLGLKSEIVAVGTELLLGQIANTNAQYLSQKLSEIGIDVYYHTAVGDNATRIKEVLHLARQRSDLIILTGGLGPTEDDLTKEMVAELLGRPLVVHQPSLDKITAFFAKRGLVMTENNRKQANVIQGSRIFENHYGLAPGMAVSDAEKKIWYVLLPGPPREMKPMVQDFVLPFLASLLPEPLVIHSKVLHFYGIGESLLEDRIKDLIQQQNNPTIAPLAGDREVNVRLTAKAVSKEKAEQMLQPLVEELYRRFPNHIYAEGENLRLEHILIEELRKRGDTLAVAESCTGGQLSRSITSVAGSSTVFQGGVVSYSLATKRDVLGIPQDLLDQYGTVSRQTAEAMAEHVQRLCRTTCGIGITGVAGPDELEGQPVGLVWIAWRLGERSHVREYQYAGDRQEIQTRAVKTAMFKLIQLLREKG